MKSWPKVKLGQVQVGSNIAQNHSSSFLWCHVTKKRDFVRRRGFGISEAAFDREHFANQLEVSTTSDSKVMAHYVFFMFGVILTLTFYLSRSLFVCGVNIYPLVSTKKYWTFSVAEFLWYDCTLKKPMYRPCDLDLWPMKVNYFLWIYYQPISILYKFDV